MTGHPSENSVVSELKIEVAMLKQEVLFINKLFEKMDIVISKIDSQHDLLLDKTTKVESTITFTKDELKNLSTALERTEKEIGERIAAIEKLLSSKITDTQTSLSVRLDKQEEITNWFSNIKLVIIGILGLIAYLSANLDFIKKLF